MRIRTLLGVLLLSLPVPCPAQQIELPVFFVRYDGGLGSEAIDPEEEDEVEEMEPSSQRHRLTLRIKEEWNEALTTNLYTVLSRKEYLLQAGSYSYVYLSPDVSWRLTDGVRWQTAFRAKWIWYDELDAAGRPKDILSLLARSALSWDPLDRLRVTPAFQGIFDLYRDETDVRQTYIAGLSVESRSARGLRVSGRYRGILRFPLGEASTVGRRFNHEFAVNLSWDPNR
jgi:hypothetical protein